MPALFVYGTLMRGEANHRFLATQEYLGPRRTAPAFALHDLGPYPAMVAGSGEIEGELFAIDPGILPELDRFEGHPTLFARTEIRVGPEGERALCYLYAAPLPDSARLIACGSWRRR
jgi:gamma-glutamylcyclotransferase (GGCT)/AIG2-like uncharacterized protein YtfP